MQQLKIPQIGDEVEYFLTYDGDEEISGPFAAVVLVVDLTTQPFPLLDLCVSFPQHGPAMSPRVPFRSGKQYWLPKV